MENIDPKNCTSSPRGHAGEYGKIGFSPCGEYVSHDSDKPCNVIENTDNPEISPEVRCTCRTEKCFCGSFVSHKVSEPCTVISI